MKRYPICLCTSKGVIPCVSRAHQPTKSPSQNSQTKALNVLLNRAHQSTLQTSRNYKKEGRSGFLSRGMELCCLAAASSFLNGNSLNLAASESAKLRNAFAFYRSDPVRVTTRSEGEKIRRRREFSAPHCAMEEVKTTAAWVASRSSHVFVESSGSNLYPSFLVFRVLRFCLDGFLGLFGFDGECESCLL